MAQKPLGKRRIRESFAPSPLRALLAMPREKDVYFAKLAEQAERYDEMADYMKDGGKWGGDGWGDDYFWV